MTNLNFEHHLGSLTHAALSQASIISRVWGEGPSERYDELAKNFRPTFARIKEGALIREQQHILPYEQLQWLKDIDLNDLNDLDMRQLLFKNKDETYVKLCAQFAQLNAQLVGLCDTFTASQMTHLIDDMFYSEHIFEKLSVYSEYMQTLLQSQHSLQKKEIA